MKFIKLSLLALLILTIGAYAANKVLNSKGSGAPSFVIEKEKITVPCQYSDSDLRQGLIASDEEDGDLTDRIMIGNFSRFKSRGVADLSYVVYDSDGNNDTCTRTVQFSDYKSPQITFFKPCVYFARATKSSALGENAKAQDMLDGDVTKRVKVTRTDADFNVPGKYTVSVYVDNSFGDEVYMNFPVHILDPAEGGLTISLEECVVYMDKGAGFTPEEYVGEVTGESTGLTLSPEEYTMSIDSDVDVSKDGVYEVHYSAVSTDGLLVGNTWLTVVVGNYGG